jgi:N-hydroxyarylamine O-acetyltransferase
MRLHEYLERVAVDQSLDVTVETLRRLHATHRETFLFENLAIQTGGAISVALDDVERKFLDDCRGGYCFEHNTLFAAVLRDVGFSPIPLLGRVRRGPPALWARTHMVHAVPVSARDASAGGAGLWLADVGFGAIGLVEPMLLGEGAAVRQAGLTYSLRREPAVWVLSMQDATSTSVDLYEFSEDPQTIGDVVVANHYTSTHPESIFRRTLTIQSVRGAERTILTDQTLTRYSDGRMTIEPFERKRLPDLARDLFGVELPHGPFVCDSYTPVPA